MSLSRTRRSDATTKLISHRYFLAERTLVDGTFQPEIAVIVAGGTHHARRPCERGGARRRRRALATAAAAARHAQRAQPLVPVHAARHRRRLRLLHLARPRPLRLHPAHGRGGRLPRRALRLRRDDAHRRHHRLRLLLHPPRRQRERPRRHPRRPRPRHAHRAGAHDVRLGRRADRVSGDDRRRRSGARANSGRSIVGATTCMSAPRRTRRTPPAPR